MRNKNLGLNATDIITGFTGVITGHADYISGCDQYLLSPSCVKGEPHKIPEGKWFDENRIQISDLEEPIVLATGEGLNDNGADLEAPIK